MSAIKLLSCGRKPVGRDSLATISDHLLSPPRFHVTSIPHSINLYAMSKVCTAAGKAPLPAGERAVSDAERKRLAFGDFICKQIRRLKDAGPMPPQAGQRGNKFSPLRRGLFDCGSVRRRGAVFVLVVHRMYLSYTSCVSLSV